MINIEATGNFMALALQPVIEDLDKALGRLENVVAQRLHTSEEKSDPDVSEKIKARLDQTIYRLETLLTAE